jgi:hypothetical protein
VNTTTSRPADVWFIRFPDGRVLRAASTSVVREQLGSGRIPPGSRVRRSPDEEWVALEWTQEFADLVERHVDKVPSGSSPTRPRVSSSPSGEHSTIAARLDPTQLHTVGVRGMIEELLAALDGTLVRKKLLVAVVLGLFLSAVVALSPVLENVLPDWRARWAVIGLAGLVASAMGTALLSNMTYVELSRLRPARWSDATSGFLALTFRVALSQLLTAGGILLLIGLSYWLPQWLLTADDFANPVVRDVLASVAVSGGLVLVVLLWPLFGFTLLLGPILVVEGCSVWKGLREWLRLLREDLGRVFLYEALAAALGFVSTLPLIVPLLATLGLPVEERFAPVAWHTRTVLAGLALAPFWAYLVVANVFIYLNLRYENAARR